jgi:hypothetical protein
LFDYQLQRINPLRFPNPICVWSCIRKGSLATGPQMGLREKLFMSKAMIKGQLLYWGIVFISIGSAETIVKDSFWGGIATLLGAILTATYTSL